MERRHFVKGLTVLGASALFVPAARAAEGVGWGYEGNVGPKRWGELDKAYAACATGPQQSPLDITGAVKAELPPIVPDWKSGPGDIVNNGHTIEISVPAGSRLTHGQKVYDLLQIHLHAPSEHLVDGKPFAMEVHFVHKEVSGDALGVVGLFLTPGKANAAFARLAAVFPAETGGKAGLDDFDPAALLPSRLAYWFYEGSLTTPPCSEIVDWMVVMDPLEVDAADIARFTAIYPMNARPVAASHRRFILASS